MGMLKATPLLVPLVRGDGGVDADDFAVHVDEWAAAGAGIDGGVGLQEVLDADGVAQADLAAIAGTDDAVRHGLGQAERTAHGQHHWPTRALSLLPIGAVRRSTRRRRS